MEFPIHIVYNYIIPHKCKNICKKKIDNYYFYVFTLNGIYNANDVRGSQTNWIFYLVKYNKNENVYLLYRCISSCVGKKTKLFIIVDKLRTGALQRFGVT